MQPTLTIAMRAARAAADKLRYAFQQKPNLLAEGFTADQILQDTLEGAAARVAKVIRNAHPTHSILFSQTGLDQARNPDDQHQWYVNLLSGEANYRTGFPGVVVCVAHSFRGKFEQVAMINIFSDEEFACSRGRGLTRNDQRVRVSSAKKLQGSLVSIHNPTNDILWHQFCVDQQIGQRQSGSALLTTVQFCSGHTDFCIIQGLSPQELQISALVIQESGGISGDRKGRPLGASSDEAIAANPKLFKLLLQSL